jgi:SAM-dependent MidA family methyltransferase
VASSSATSPPAGYLPWQQAWHRALFAPDGFYRRDAPASHFRTAAHAGPAELAHALTALAVTHRCRRIIDLGAGRAELLRAVRAVSPGLALHAVDVVGRPPDLPAAIGWSTGLAELPDELWDGALVVAWELLDTVPCPVLERDDDGVLRQVLVSPGGDEQLGAPATDTDLEWCRRWWPEPGEADPAGGSRAEVGLERDELWAHLVSRAHTRAAGRRSVGERTVLLAVDYAHQRDRRPPQGSLTGYRAGRQVAPAPDGSCDITAHVAIDAVAAAGEAAGARTLELTTQRQALTALGVQARPRPGRPLTAADLARLGRESELIDPAGLGSFSWLLQVVARTDPAE